MVLFLRLASRSFEAAAGGRNGEEELPAALCCVDGAPPQEGVRDKTQAHALLTSLLESAVAGVRNNPIFVSRELVLAQKPCRAPVGAIHLGSSIYRPAGSNVVDD